VKIRSTVAYYISYITIGFATGIIGPTLQGLAGQTGAMLKGISLLFPVLSVGYLIGSLTSGHIFDRIKGHPVIAGAIVLMAAAMALVPAVSLFWILMLLFFIIGLASSCVDVGGNALIIWVHRDKVAPFMVGLHFFFGFGAFFAPMVVGQTLKTAGGFEWSYWILAIICIPVALYFLLIRSPEQIKSSGKDQQGTIHIPLVILITLFMFLHVGVELSFGGWIYSYAVKRELATASAAAYLTSAYWGALTAGRLVSVFVSMKLQTRSMLVLYLSGCILAVLLLLLGGASVPTAWAATILLGFSISALVPVTFTFAGENMPITGQVTSWLVIGIGAGNMFFPWFVGQLFESAGPAVLPVTNLITLFIALILILYIFRYSRRGVKEL